MAAGLGKLAAVPAKSGQGEASNAKQAATGAIGTKAIDCGSGQVVALVSEDSERLAIRALADEDVITCPVNNQLHL